MGVKELEKYEIDPDAYYVALVTHAVIDGVVYFECLSNTGPYRASPDLSLCRHQKCLTAAMAKCVAGRIAAGQHVRALDQAIDWRLEIGETPETTRTVEAVAQIVDEALGLKPRRGRPRHLS